MSEDIQLRLMSVELAVKALRDTAVEDGEIVTLAKEIFEFVKGETK